MRRVTTVAPARSSLCRQATAGILSGVGCTPVRRSHAESIATAGRRSRSNVRRGFRFFVLSLVTRRSRSREASPSALERTTPKKPLLVFARRSAPRPSRAYRTYWRFTAERQAIFYRRLRGLPAPWTQDVILQDFKFTNAYRVLDRTTQYLIDHVISGADGSTADILFRVALFKLFNRRSTWELLTRSSGTPTLASFDGRAYSAILRTALRGGSRIYSAAYILPPAVQFPAAHKHDTHLALLAHLRHSGFFSQLLGARSLADLYERLLAVPMLGPFLAFQLAIDMNYAECFRFSEMEFVVAGPGAREGIRKCFVSTGEYSDRDVIAWMTDSQVLATEQGDVPFVPLPGRPLQLIDCQNLFCEVGKYARLAHPELTVLGGRTRIKQRFRPLSSDIRVSFPAWWKMKSDAVTEAARAYL